MPCRSHREPIAERAAVPPPARSNSRPVDGTVGWRRGSPLPGERPGLSRPTVPRKSSSGQAERECIMCADRPITEEGREIRPMTVPLSKVTVLILDDNPLVLKLGRALLEREGCTVLTAASWIEFNHVLAGNTPDIIFLDVNLPSIKGNRLSEVLKSQSNKKDIPIVLISDLPEKSLEEMFPSSGANAWMRKPLTRDKMVDMINRYVKE